MVLGKTEKQRTSLKCIKEIKSNWLEPMFRRHSLTVNAIEGRIKGRRMTIINSIKRGGNEKNT